MDEPTTNAALHGENAEARSQAARLLGRSKTEAKARAARENGRKGGRPKGIPVSEETRRKMGDSKKADNDLRRDASVREQDGTQ